MHCWNFKTQKFYILFFLYKGTHKHMRILVSIPQYVIPISHLKTSIPFWRGGTSPSREQSKYF